MADQKREWIKIGITQSVDELRMFGPTVPLHISAGDETGARPFQVNAQIDTGANLSCCGPQIGKRLGAPAGSILLQAAGSKPQDVPLFSAMLWFPGGTGIKANLAVLASLGEPHDVLIGRDILGVCRLEVNFTTGLVDLHFKIS